MTIFLFAIAAAGCASLSNLFFRKCSSTHAGTYRFLFIYFLVSFAGSFLIRPDLLAGAWNPMIFSVGCCAGILNVLMMIITSRALQHTSAGITFTFQNASSVFPNPLLFLFFGSSFEFIVTGHQIAGMFLILIGLFLGISQNTKDLTKSNKWIKYVLGAFLVQIIILSIMQGRSIVFPEGEVDDSDVWFMIGFFGMALLFQSMVYLNHKREQKGPQAENKMSEIVYGTLSGIANVSSTYLLLQATRWANPLESGLIFPLFAVSVIILCNLWGYWLYQERPKYSTIALCSSGIVVAAKMGFG
jgi:drug/metabolite transporter (DMT)-like permease